MRRCLGCGAAEHLGQSCLGAEQNRLAKERQLGLGLPKPVTVLQPRAPEPLKLDEGECRDCKAPLYWVTMVGSGRKMPLERGADQRVVIDKATGEGRLERVYKPHWVSCPFAKNFKKGDK